METSSITLGRSISYIRGVWLVLLLSYFVEISELNANSVDPYQTPSSVASDLGLHCLLMSLIWDDRLKWVNVEHHSVDWWFVSLAVTLLLSVCVPSLLVAITLPSHP